MALCLYVAIDIEVVLYCWCILWQQENFVWLYGGRDYMRLVAIESCKEGFVGDEIVMELWIPRRF